MPHQIANLQASGGQLVHANLCVTNIPGFHEFVLPTREDNREVPPKTRYGTGLQIVGMPLDRQLRKWASATVIENSDIGVVPSSNDEMGDILGPRSAPSFTNIAHNQIDPQPLT